MEVVNLSPHNSHAVIALKPRNYNSDISTAQYKVLHAVHKLAQTWVYKAVKQFMLDSQSNMNLPE